MTNGRRLRGLAVLLDSPTSGGIERYAADLMQISSEAIDWGVLRVCRSDAGGRLGQARAAARGIRLNRASGLDLVFADRLHVLPVACAVRAGIWPSHPFLTVGVYGSELLSHSRRRLKTWAARQADALIACSAWSARAARTSLGFDGSISVIHPGIEPGAWAAPPRWAPRQQGFEQGRGSIQLVTIARLEPNSRHKGIDRTIEAIRLLRAQGVDARYVIVGAGPDESWVDECIRSTGTASAVTRLGWVPQPRLREILWASDAFVLPTVPSREDAGTESVEGFGIALLEAAAAGVPVITTGDGGTAEAFAPGVTGVQVDGSPASIADAVMELRTSPIDLQSDDAKVWLAQFAWPGRAPEVTRALTGGSVMPVEAPPRIRR